MKASELIEKLKTAIDAHGDLIVIAYDDKEQSAEVRGVDLSFLEGRNADGGYVEIPALEIHAQYYQPNCSHCGDYGGYYIPDKNLRAVWTKCPMCCPTASSG